jgi:hypothetical protein
VQKPPSLRNNNGSLQVRVRIDGRDAFINRLGRWSDPVAVALTYFLGCCLAHARLTELRGLKKISL